MINKFLVAEKSHLNQNRAIKVLSIAVYTK